MGSILWRTMVITHRYLGVAIGLLMLVWFVSGIVMMYVQFPRVSEAERLRLVPMIPWQMCCHFAEGTLSDQQPVQRAQVENHLGVPVIRLRRQGQLDSVIDLAQGTRVTIDAEVARKVALETAPHVL